MNKQRCRVVHLTYVNGKLHNETEDMRNVYFRTNGPPYITDLGGRRVVSKCPENPGSYIAKYFVKSVKTTTAKEIFKSLGIST